MVTVFLELADGQELRIQRQQHEIEALGLSVGQEVVAREFSVTPISFRNDRPIEGAAMSILIRNATILAMDAATDGALHRRRARHGRPDRGGGRGAARATAERVIDGRHRLVMPGLVNGHLHSSEALFKGRYDNLPLEFWMLYSYPILGTSALAERLDLSAHHAGGDRIAEERCHLCYRRRVRSATARISTGSARCSTPMPIAACAPTVSGHVIDRNFLDTIPFTDRFVPAALRERIAANPVPSAQDYLAFSRAAFQTFHNRLGRLRYMVAPSAPQRCTPELMQAADGLARQHRVPFHTHIVETKVQAVTGPALYGKTLVRYMHDLGLLHGGVTIAHSDLGHR